MANVKYDTGYGILHKSVMLDTELSLQAKAVFAYLVTYAGNGDVAFPSRELMCYHLNINNHTLGKYLKELKEKGYIKVEQVKEDGKFSHNVYTLIPYVNSSHTVDVQAVDVQSTNVHTNNNSSNNNSNNNNNKYNYQEVIDYLNEKAGKSYKAVKTNNKHINARYEEGYTLEDFKTVIDYKTSKWKGTEWEKYLRPSTLFSAEHFENYLNEAPKRSIECTKTEEVDEGEFTNFLDIMKRGGLE